MTAPKIEVGFVISVNDILLSVYGNFCVWLEKRGIDSLAVQSLETFHEDLHLPPSEAETLMKAFLSSPYYYASMPTAESVQLVGLIDEAGFDIRPVIDADLTPLAYRMLSGTLRDHFGEGVLKPVKTVRTGSDVVNYAMDVTLGNLHEVQKGMFYIDRNPDRVLGYDRLNLDGFFVDHPGTVFSDLKFTHARRVLSLTAVLARVKEL